MNKEYTVLTMVIAAFTVVTAGAVWLLWQDLAVTQGNTADVNRAESFPERRALGSMGAESNDTLAFQAEMNDVYGAVQPGGVTVTIDTITKKARYALTLPGLTPPQGEGRYLVWLQTDEGPVTRLGTLTLADGVGTLETVGAPPAAGWFVLVTYEPEPEGEQELILRGEIATAQ